MSKNKAGRKRNDKAQRYPSGKIRPERVGLTPETTFKLASIGVNAKEWASCKASVVGLAEVKSIITKNQRAAGDELQRMMLMRRALWRQTGTPIYKSCSEILTKLAAIPHSSIERPDISIDDLTKLGKRIRDAMDGLCAQEKKCVDEIIDIEIVDPQEANNLLKTYALILPAMLTSIAKNLKMRTD